MISFTNVLEVLFESTKLHNNPHSTNFLSIFDQYHQEKYLFTEKHPTPGEHRANTLSFNRTPLGCQFVLNRKPRLR